MHFHFCPEEALALATFLQTAPTAIRVALSRTLGWFKAHRLWPS